VRGDHVSVSAVQLEPPVLADVVAAAARIEPHLRPTELRSYPSLSALVGTEVWVKHENRLPTGAFKVRGGINLVAQLSPEVRDAGLIAASTGNHGQSIAYAAQLYGARAVICVPEGANAVKVASIQALGAEVIFHGKDFDEAREHCAGLAQENGYRYVHSGDEPDLLAGVGTATLEILAEQPDIDTIIVPIGGGSGAAGVCIAGKAVHPALEVIGVQSAAAPAAYRSWREGRIVEDQMETFAEGLATRVGFELPQRVLHDQLDDFVLVDDDAIRSALLQMIESTRTLVEAAGAAPLAAALELRARLAGRKVALICSGGNITMPQLTALLTASSP
jgi:threonine dehydratase